MISYLNSIVGQIKPKILQHKYIAISVGSIIGVILVRKLSSGNERPKEVKSYPPDVVIVHQFRRGLYAPRFN